MRATRTVLHPAALCLLWASFASAAIAGEDATFQSAYASKDAFMLTAWGKRYETGVGVGRDPDKAARLYCKAAKKGDVEAQYQLGQMYAASSRTGSSPPPGSTRPRPTMPRPPPC
jgi:TPR repeat protein